MPKQFHTSRSQGFGSWIAGTKWAQIGYGTQGAAQLVIFDSNKILSPGFKTTCVRTQENDIHQLNKYSKCDCMTG